MSNSRGTGRARDLRLGQEFNCESSPAAVPLVDLKELRFPFQGAVRPGESGQGYALRMAAENQLNGLPQLKSLLGKSRFATLDALDAPLLHRWFGANEKDLDHALGWTHIGRQAEGYVYASQLFGRSYFLNRGYPRVCFACLQSDGYCRAAWDFSLAAACARHRIVLSEACPNCTRPLSWNRPAPGVCSCHLELIPQPYATQATQLEIQFSAWIERKISGQTVAGDEREPFESSIDLHRCELESLVQLIWPLSLNGGMHIAFALATAAGLDGAPGSAGPRPRTPLKKAQHILIAANEFARRVGRSVEQPLLVKRPSAVIQLLADCMEGGAPPADRQLSQSLLATVLYQKRKTKWSGVNPQLSQMLLF